MWTGFYTEYDLTLVYDVFSYFRSGIMPLVIADYTQYNQFAVAAPEIKGLWSIHRSGNRQEDGSIKRTESATGTASVLMESAENKEAAFQFLDWWSTEEIQTRYSRELEATMGPAARYNSANVETLRNLAWKPSEYKTIAAQWEQVWDIPSIPSSYYVTRNVTNVFRNVVYKNTNERETLNKYAKIIDKEILRKTRNWELYHERGMHLETRKESGRTGNADIRSADYEKPYQLSYVGTFCDIVSGFYHYTGYCGNRTQLYKL